MVHLLSLLSLTLAGTRSALAQDNVGPSFTQSNLVPGLLSRFNPKAEVHVTFGSPNTLQRSQIVKPGAVLEPHQLLHPPKWTLNTGSEEYSAPSFIPRMFAIAMIDIDTKTLHYLHGDFDSRYISQGVPALKYAPPKPASRTRYTVLIYDQNSLPNPDKSWSQTVTDEFGASLTPTSFDITKFAQTMGMTGPIAATVFFVEPTATSSFNFSTASARFKEQATTTNVAVVGAVAIGVFALTRLRFFRRVKAARDARDK
ncbi:hypothetical protein HGRIS_003123 [Hohenbuehelia grisea]|uniref:Uncharacterized protein n=1 Tax=Hohenbuehelia grisea TaxID=104357 RepID=A0ABR3JNE3_9AGAR